MPNVKPLFTTHTEYTYEEYRKMCSVVRNKIQKMNLRIIAGFIALFICFICLFLLKEYGFALSFFIAAFGFPVATNIVLKLSVVKEWKTNKIIKNMRAKYSFFEDHFEVDNESGHTSIYYDNIFKILETGTNIYIMISENQSMIIIKKNCSPELLAFLQEIHMKINKI